jgi:hypothetical protein
MKIIYAIVLFLFSITITKASNSALIDTVNVEIQSDEACPGAIINFHLINKSATPLDSIRWRGDYDVISNNYFFEKYGTALEYNVLNPKWIFFSKNGIGKFPISIEVKNVLGFYKTYYDTVETGEPWIHILNDPATCCGLNDTIKVDVRFLTKPYNICMWYDNAVDTFFSVLSFNKDKFPVSLLAGRTSIDLKVRIEDSKGCTAEATKFFNLTTNISETKKGNIIISPNPTSNNIIISGLPENNDNPAVLFNIQGKVMMNFKAENNVPIDLSLFDNGVYLLKVGQVVKRVVKM